MLRTGECRWRNVRMMVNVLEIVLSPLVLGQNVLLNVLAKKATKRELIKLQREKKMGEFHVQKEWSQSPVIAVFPALLTASMSGLPGPVVIVARGNRPGLLT